MWTRSAAESVLTTQLLKDIRDAKIDIDSVAVECLKQTGDLYWRVQWLQVPPLF